MQLIILYTEEKGFLFVQNGIDMNRLKNGLYLTDINVI